MLLSRAVRGGLAVMMSAAMLAASEHHGVVRVGEVAIPGASVSATRGDTRLTVITDDKGAYTFPDLPDGPWSIQVEMQCFAPAKKDIEIKAGGPAEDFELKLLPMEEIKAAEAPVVTSATPLSTAPGTSSAAAPSVRNNARPNSKNAKNGPVTQTNTASGFQRTEVNASADASKVQNETPDPSTTSEMNRNASDGLVVNGSVNNGAASPFAQSQAFGNFRRGIRSLYTGGIGLTLDTSVLDARTYSLTGQDTPKPDLTKVTGLVNFGGPLKIPHLVRNGPNIFVNYQWTRNRSANTLSTLVPTALQRSGDFSQTLDPLGRPVTIVDPKTGLPIAGNVLSPSQISQQAQFLEKFYPLPNFTSTRYNYQVPIASAQHSDGLQLRVNKGVTRRDQISGNFNFQSTRGDSNNIFNFLDGNRSLGINTGINWSHRFGLRMFLTSGFQFSRSTARFTPFFANRENVAGEAGITGNNQEPANWGPPTLAFANGIAALFDRQNSLTRNQTSGITTDLLISKNPHTFRMGFNLRHQQFNYLSQQDPRGSFQFNGTAAGDAFAGFLLGVPDASSIAFGNADKYFRSSTYEAYFNDDWRFNSSLTINGGLRWEYTSPITELYGRLVNLDVVSGFSAVKPVVANSPLGPLTGLQYPDSLINPDKHAFQPRLGIAWRPLPASSMVIRAGYGITYNTSVYQSLAIQMAQQSPLSTSLRLQNSAATPLTLARGFNAPPNVVTNTFGIDPNFRIGYAQSWNASIQRDLPGGLQMNVNYLGIKGTRGQQDFLPNTVAPGTAPTCPLCPNGFEYYASNGNSIRHAGTAQLRRRLHNGLTAQVQYTYAKSIDDSALGGQGGNGSVIAQNWRDLSAERARSVFDQRHNLQLTGQYTSGMGLKGGALLGGWRGALLKEWTITSQVTIGSGLPLTPTFATAIAGVTGPIRADYLGGSVYDAPSGFFLNRQVYAAPVGHFGNAGRDSINGPSQFSLNAGASRTFRLNDRLNLDLRVDATNALNHVVYASYVSQISSSQFGLPTGANAMRSLLTTFRLRF